MPLIVLDISYDEMYLDALENGWLELIDTMIVPVGNHPLFKKKEVLAAIPYWGSSNMDLPLVWDSQFVFSNSLQQSPESFRLILGKEKYKTDELSQLMMGDVQSGRVFWNGKSTVYQLQNMEFVTKSTIQGFPSSNKKILLSGSYTFKGVTWYNELGLWQGCQQIDGRIRKPVLIVEGFDPFNDRNLDALDSQVEGYQNRCSEDSHLYWASNDEGLADELREQGYDVLILNFPHDGYPVKCKKIAISNGSAIGQEQYGFNEGDNLFTFTGYVPNPILPTTLDLRYNALPDHSFKTIFSGYTNIMLFGVLPVSLNVAIKSVNNTDALDNAPAGTQVFHSQIFNN